MKILVVDDDDLMHLTLKTIFKNESLTFATTTDSALQHLSKDSFNVVFLDIQLTRTNGGDGIELLKKIRQRDRYLPCVMISALDDRATVMKCFELGAVDYVAKGTVAPEAYRLAVYKAAAWRKLLSDSPECRVLEVPMPNNYEMNQIKSSAKTMIDLKNHIFKIAKLPGPFLILGETGTGKELVAKALWSGRGDRNRPFIAVNCASLPSNLVESELFGYERGAFTGAINAKAGLFEAANGGDIFLDEVGELSIDLQAKFLRVLQDGRVRRIGSDKERPLDIRILAATNVDLMQAVNEKEFREDLFYRLNVHQVRLPPLRERLGDIIELLTFFLRVNGFSGIKIDEKAKELLLTYSWPGNVRQLKSLAEYFRPYLDSSDSIITPQLVNQWIQNNQVGHRNSSSSNLKEKTNSEIQAAFSSNKSLNLVGMLEEIQKNYVESALEITKNNRSQAARILGVSRQRLGNWLSDWGIF